MHFNGWKGNCSTNFNNSQKNKFTSSSEEIIATIEAIILKINGEIVELHFYSDNN